MAEAADLGIGEGRAMVAHPLRAAVLAELHARPFFPATTPRRYLHVAFLTDAAHPNAAREGVEAFCGERGVAGPAPGAKHHRVELGGAVLRWESHAEFSTYTWDFPSTELAPGLLPFQPPALTFASPLSQIPQPGPLLVAVDLHLVTDTAEDIHLEAVFDPASLARSDVNDGTAEIATDFKPDPSGFVRILVRDRGLGTEAAGALVQRVLEIETYRLLALLGLPQAQRLGPDITRIEAQLARMTGEMRHSEGLAGNARMLDELVVLAAELEAGATASLFRFGASRAYHDIVKLRLSTVREAVHSRLSHLAAIPRPPHGAGHAHLRCGGGPAGGYFRQARPRRRPPAHARQCGSGAAEPGPSRLHERAHAAAIAPPADGGGAVGGGHQLLCGKSRPPDGGGHSPERHRPSARLCPQSRLRHRLGRARCRSLRLERGAADPTVP